jgi:protein-L-isoaspartate(D-aspartate) O-methyltransferase
MSEPNFEEMRRVMVATQLRTTGVNDPGVLAAMGAVPRERFVPAERAAIAYADGLIPLGSGRNLNTPMSLGRLLTEAAPRSGEHAMVIGAATGYAAAVLARLVGTVVAVEEDETLLAAARANLAGSNVTLVKAPLARGHAKSAPYDLILVDGAIETVPDALIAQLKDGGRLAAAILDHGVARLSIGRKAGQGFGMTAVSDWEAARLPGFEKPREFVF